MKIAGGVAVITGGAGGIGFELAKLLLSKGCSVSICDNSEERLESAVKKLREVSSKNENVKCSSHVVDVTDRECVERYSRTVVDEHGKVSLLFNNAGVVAANTLENSSWEDIDTVMNVNINGVINCTKIFLPILSTEKEAYVVNISSLEGIIALPGDLTYCTSKFAVRGFSEALMLDNALTKPHVRVLVVHPGMIATDMIMNNETRINPNALMIKGYEKYTDKVNVLSLSNGFKSISSTTPAQAAAQIISSVAGNKTRCLVGTDCYILDLLFRLFPRFFYNKYVYFPTVAVVLFLVKTVGKKTILLVLTLLAYRNYLKT
eukprot:CAMPEP_0184041796 /NCGR_PEP_ID=MMETSP0955-20130417/64188_1 /TAXON_ID=627963 /ORGANISM="Aplanochytrium sp, Strain PBS07" /LENGTH=318 /DNA_ID=CAMNT_0026332301 /DNA_START=52 /DNA_END=1005 /DNA_ORIENTATION=-